METIIGFTGKDYVLIISDTAAVRSIVKFKDDEDRIMELDKDKLLAATGPNGDRVSFTEYVQRNVALYNLRNEPSKLSVHAAANFTRGELAAALRKKPFQVSCLLGGTEKDGSPALYYLDYLGSMHKVDKAAHGYGSNFVFSTLDAHYRKEMNLEQGLAVMRKCVHELRTRFLINAPFFKAKVVDKNGTRTVALE